MNFKYKCWLQRMFSCIPKGEKLNFIVQRYVTKKYPISDEKFIKVTNTTEDHFEKFMKYAQLSDTNSRTCYEFGAGWDLINPIGLSLLGIKKVYCIDIRELVFYNLLNDTVSKFCRLKKNIPFDYTMPEEIPIFTMSNFKDVLAECFGIVYRAPMDARDTDIGDSSIDFIVSNLTFEHIPKEAVPEIFSDCYRILKKGGILSCRIDYRDHWSYFDRNISIYNFLKYSPSKWRRYNPSLHYQNRFRHVDYLNIINQMDFEIIEDNPVPPSDKEMELLKTLEIDSVFLDNYTCDELAIKEAAIVLRK